MTKQEEQAHLLTYFSTIYNKSLPAYELVSSKNYDEKVVLLVTNELFSLIEIARLFYTTSPAIHSPEVVKVFDAIDDFYLELRHVFLHAEKDTALLYSKLTTMNEHYETLTTNYNVL